MVNLGLSVRTEQPDAPGPSYPRCIGTYQWWNNIDGGHAVETPAHELLITAANHALTDDTVEVAAVPADVIRRQKRR